MKQLSLFFIRCERVFVFSLAAALACLPAAAQQSPANSEDKSLAESVQELRVQVQELRAAVADMKSEAAQYRAQSDELRAELATLRTTAPAVTGIAAPEKAQSAVANLPADQRLSTIEETTQVLQSELRSQYQTKVESASKYRARISGLVLMNLFSNRGSVDNIDFPSYATSGNLYGSRSSFGATLRQSELGLEVFGPQLAGAKSSGEIRFDFGGGFPSGALDGINTGLVRLRTATVRLDWDKTSVIVGQDNLFISPLSPTSFASLVIPSFGYAGNLWAWTPQVRLQHKFDLTDSSDVTVQAGILDNVTGEASYGTHRQPQAGESTGQPAYAARTAWNGSLAGRPASFGASGYYSRQNWGSGWYADGWLAATDWRLPLASRFELSGEFYRGRAVGGVGGGIGQSVLFSGNPGDPASDFRPLNSTGGWAQLKFAPASRLEFNGAFGIDNPFARDIHAYPSPVSVYPQVLAANRGELVNFIYRPRSDLLFSAEYRHLRTAQIGALNMADQVNLIMGVLF